MKSAIESLMSLEMPSS